MITYKGTWPDARHTEMSSLLKNMCLFMCICTCACVGLARLEKKTIELEFQVILNHSAWILVSKLGSIRAVCALSH